MCLIKNKNISKKVNEKTDDYIREYRFDENSKILTKNDFDYLLTLSNMFYFKPMEVIEERGYLICKKYINEIEEKGIGEYFPGMLAGLGYKIYAINTYAKSTQNILKTAQKLNEILLDRTIDYINYIKNNKIKTQIYFYDAVYGISGVLYYLLDDKILVKKICKLKLLVEFLLNYASMHLYHRKKIINFYIDQDSIKRLEEKQLFLKGYINFGMAHGMMGPLLALAKAYQYEFLNGKVKNAIWNILTVYNTFERKINCKLFWPRQLSLENYENIFFIPDAKKERASWCYGSISILRGMIKVYNILGEQDLQKKYSDMLKTVLLSSPDENGLNLPILCHGYSSVLTIQAIVYKEIKDPDIIKSAKNYIYNILNFKSQSSGFYDEWNENDYSFLQGKSGCVLALISSVCDKLTYSKILMMD